VSNFVLFGVLIFNHNFAVWHKTRYRMALFCGKARRIVASKHHSVYCLMMKEIGL
jgi:hypothetical protein